MAFWSSLNQLLARSFWFHYSFKLIYSIYDLGYSVIDILDNYFLFIKLTKILNENEKFLIIKLLCKYITIFYNIHEDEIELSLFTNNLLKLLS